MDKKRLQIEEKLFKVVTDLLRELYGDYALPRISRKALIARDLGIDSLGKIELFHRLEDSFRCRLPISLLEETETLDEIVVVLAGQTGAEITFDRSTLLTNPAQTGGAFVKTDTIIESILAYVEADPLRPHIYLQDEFGNEKCITYGDLFENARKVAQGLAAKGLQYGQTVAIILPTSEEFFEAFLGVQFAGGIPVPIYPPVRSHRLEEYVQRESKILKNAEVQFLISFNPAKQLNKILKSFIPSLRAVVTVPALKRIHGTLSHQMILPQDSGMIQYTSGSTGDPKGVLLSHAISFRIYRRSRRPLR